MSWWLNKHYVIKCSVYSAFMKIDLYMKSTWKDEKDVNSRPIEVDVSPEELDVFLKLVDDGSFPYTLPHFCVSSRVVWGWEAKS